MGDRPYSMIADDQAFSRAQFRAVPWAGAAGRLQHLAAGRGRQLAPVSRAVFSASTEVARFIFDATPLETAYSVAVGIATIRSPAAPYLPTTITVLIESEDTSGGNTASDTYTVQWRPPRPQDFGMADRLKIVDQSYAFIDQIYSPLGWFAHRVSGSLPTQARVLKVSLAASDTDRWYGFSASISAVGYRA